MCYQGVIQKYSTEDVRHQLGNSIKITKNLGAYLGEKVFPIWRLKAQEEP